MSSLRVDSRSRLLSGGDSGAAIVPGDPDSSYLIDLVSDSDPAVRMPLENDPLTPEQIVLLRRWISEGALWDDDFQPAATQARHWAFGPVQNPAVPQVTDGSGAGVHPVDAFLIEALGRRGLKMSPETDPRTFIRRATLDLTGLPPTPEEVQEFVSECDAVGGAGKLNDAAVERLIDRLLASPHYGERWAQHWLDVIRYADTQGYELNNVRSTAWPYRDYVIAALNDDMPYDRFLQEQLAGDTLGVDPATGFLVTPPIPSIQEVGQEPAAVVQARFNALDEVVQNVGGAILGLSVGCARCHHHKFDPITARDYYRLIANFSGLRFAERPWDDGALPVARRNRAARELADLSRRLSEYPAWREQDTTHSTDFFPPVRARWIRLTINRTANSKFGAALDELEVWAIDENSDPQQPASGCQPGAADLTGAAANGLSSDTLTMNVAGAERGAIARSSGAASEIDVSEESLNDGKLGPQSIWISARFGRKSTDWVEIELPEAQLIGAVTWHCPLDGGGADNVPFKFRMPESWTVAVAEQPGQWQTVVSADRTERLSNDEFNRRKQLEQQYAEVATEFADLHHVFAGEFESPDPIHVLKRGDPQQPGERTGPGGIDVLGGYELPPEIPDAERRVAFAKWLTAEEHPLTARVMVNRAWQHHFGTGIVSTPSDFGVQGERPSHPELLDWLTHRFMAGGWKLKELHRLICTSRAYRQTSRPIAAAVPIDADSRLLWRYPPRRLEAEAIRDSILQISGALDSTMGGPGINIYDTKLKETSGEWRPRSDVGPESWRRTIYLMRMRGADDGVFKAFDVPDCGQVRAKRNRSTTPLQALNLFNSEFIMEQAERLADRIKREAGDDVDRQIDRLFLLALSRLPSDDERASCREVATTHGLETVCRVVINSNEFLMIE